MEGVVAACCAAVRGCCNVNTHTSDASHLLPRPRRSLPAVGLSREIAAARQRGAQLAPRQQPREQQQRAPPSTGRRTVRDMRLLAAAAQGGGTPGSGGHGGRGSSGSRPFVIPRISAAAPGQQPAEPASHNPFARFQLGDRRSSAGGGSGGSAGRPSQPGSPRRNRSPQPLSPVRVSSGGGTQRTYHQQQQQQQPDAWQQGRPPLPPQAQAPQPWQQRPSPAQYEPLEPTAASPSFRSASRSSASLHQPAAFHTHQASL